MEHRGKEKEALGWLCSVVLHNPAPVQLPASFLMPAEPKESVDPRQGGSSHHEALARGLGSSSPPAPLTAAKLEWPPAQPCQQQGPLPRAGGTRGSTPTVAGPESEPKPPPANQGHGSCSQQNQFKHEQLIGKELSFITGTGEKFPPGSPDCALFSLAQTHPALPNRISVRTSNSSLAVPGDTFPKEERCQGRKMS